MVLLLISLILLVASTNVKGFTNPDKSIAFFNLIFVVYFSTYNIFFECLFIISICILLLLDYNLILRRTRGLVQSNSAIAINFIGAKYLGHTMNFFDY